MRKPAFHHSKSANKRPATLITDLARIDGYERRALSRRRTAVRHLDELRAARPDTGASSEPQATGPQRASSRVGVSWHAAL